VLLCSLMCLTTVLGWFLRCFWQNKRKEWLGQNKSLKGKLCFVITKLANCTWLLVSVLYSCDLRQGTVLLHTEHLWFLAVGKELTNQFAFQTDATAAMGEPKQANKAHNMAASNNRDHTHGNSIIACSHHLHMGAILISLHWYRRLRRNNDYSTYQHGRQMDFPWWSGRKNFFRGPTVVKFDLINSKLKERHFLTKT